MTGARRLPVARAFPHGVHVDRDGNSQVSLADGVAVDCTGDIFSAVAGPRALRKYVKQ